MPTSVAICLPVWRCRRNASTPAHVAAWVWLGNEWGREERSRNPSTPSARKRLTHLATVLAETLNWSAAAAFVRPPSITLRTMASRPFGVRGAFLWVSIRSSGDWLKLRQLQLPRSGPDGQPPESSHLEQCGDLRIVDVGLVVIIEAGVRLPVKQRSTRAASGMSST